MKKIRFLPVIIIAFLFISACGIADMSKLSGEWTLTEVNGASLNQYAAVLGREACDEAVNLIISEEELKAVRLDGEKTTGIKAAENGFEVQEDGETAIPFAYDEEKDTLTCYRDELTFTFKRGSFQF